MCKLKLESIFVLPLPFGSVQTLSACRQLVDARSH